MKSIIRLGGLIGYLVSVLKTLAQNLAPFLMLVGEFVWIYARTTIITLAVISGLFSLGIAPSPLIFLNTPFNQLPRLAQLKFGLIFAGVISNFRVNSTEKNPSFMRGIYIFWFPVLSFFTNLIFANSSAFTKRESDEQTAPAERSIYSSIRNYISSFVDGIKNARDKIERFVGKMHKDAMNGSEYGEKVAAASLKKFYKLAEPEAKINYTPFSSRLFTPRHDANKDDASPIKPKLVEQQTYYNLVFPNLQV